MSTKIDLTNKRFTRLLAIEGESRTSKLGKKRMWWKCECDCGEVKYIASDKLRSDETKSCGCLRLEEMKKGRESNITHGMTDTPTYRSWQSMKIRCTNQSSPDWEDYGGRGIIVCDQWMNSFENFLNDMGERPSEGFSLDRIYVNGNYEPSNCRWSDMQTQMNNTTNVRYITYNGETHSIAEWSVIININEETLRDRINGRTNKRKEPWSVERALTTPIRYKRRA